MGSMSMLGDLSGTTSNNDKSPPSTPISAVEPTETAPAAATRSGPDHQQMERHLKEMDTLKRKHLMEVHALQRENDNLKTANATFKVQYVA